MPDKSHVESDKKLLYAESRIDWLYSEAEQKIRRKIYKLLKEIYLDDETATPKERLVYAEKDGKKEKVINEIVNILLVANREGIDIANTMSAEICLLNGGDIIGD